jgi:hypothetical protein
MLYLDKAKVGYTFFKGANTAMSAIIFGKYGSGDHIEYLGMKEDQSAFFARSEAFRIQQQFKNRARVRFAPTKILKLQIPPALDIKTAKIEKF